MSLALITGGISEASLTSDASAYLSQLDWDMIWSGTVLTLVASTEVSTDKRDHPGKTRNDQTRMLRAVSAHNDHSIRPVGKSAHAVTRSR